MNPLNTTQFFSSNQVLNINESYLESFGDGLWLRQDGTTPLTGLWNFGSEGINGSGNISTTGTLILGDGTQSQELLIKIGSSSEGKIRFENGGDDVELRRETGGGFAIELFGSDEDFRLQVNDGGTPRTIFRTDTSENYVLIPGTATRFGIGTSTPREALDVANGNAFIEGTLIIDKTNSEAFLIRKDSDGGDVFKVDTTNSIVDITGNLSITETATFGQIIDNGLTASLGVYTDGSKQLTSTPPTSGVLGYWDRTGSTLVPSNVFDDLLLGGDLAVALGDIIVSVGDFTMSAGLAQIQGDNGTTPAANAPNVMTVTGGDALDATLFTGVPGGKGGGITLTAGDGGLGDFQMGQPAGRGGDINIVAGEAGFDLVGGATQGGDIYLTTQPDDGGSFYGDVILVKDGGDVRVLQDLFIHSDDNLLCFGASNDGCFEYQASTSQVRFFNQLGSNPFLFNIGVDISSPNGAPAANAPDVLNINGGDGGITGNGHGSDANIILGNGPTAPIGVAGRGGDYSETMGDGGTSGPIGSDGGKGGSRLTTTGDGGNSVAIAISGDGGDGGDYTWDTGAGGTSAGFTAGVPGEHIWKVDGTEIMRLISDRSGLMLRDEKKVLFGTDSDASMKWNSTDGHLIINPKEVGSGTLKILGDTNITNKLGEGIHPMALEDYGQTKLGA